MRVQQAVCQALTIKSQRPRLSVASCVPLALCERSQPEASCQLCGAQILHQALSRLLLGSATLVCVTCARKLVVERQLQRPRGRPLAIALQRRERRAGDICHVLQAALQLGQPLQRRAQLSSQGLRRRLQRGRRLTLVLPLRELLSFSGLAQSGHVRGDALGHNREHRCPVLGDALYESLYFFLQILALGVVGNDRCRRQSSSAIFVVCDLPRGVHDVIFESLQQIGLHRLQSCAHDLALLSLGFADFLHLARNCSIQLGLYLGELATAS
mmetsp:Transcript_22146/g.48606  ORF Transcript_22146/g.48606 Transcript_22146/m.48606 type:complete len:270 (-) Transcript_22146:214-1023(-)